MSSSSSDHGSFDIKALKKVDGDFVRNVKAASRQLEADDAAQFFKVVLDHFHDSDLPREAGNAILHTIRRLLSRPEIVNVIRDKEVLNNLPYEESEYTDGIYDVIFDVLQFAPDLFTDDVAKKENFVQCLQEDPRKGLAIIARCAKRYVNEDEALDYPWPILDLLVKHTNVIATPELIPNFISVVVYLNQNSDEYRTSRLEKCWEKVCSLLKTRDNSLLRPIYTGLCYLRDEFKKIKKSPKLPLEHILDHLSVNDCQGPALALLVDRAHTNPREIASKELIEKLFDVAENDHNLKATLVLMKLASDPKIADDVLGNGRWLLKKLPEAVDTLRLFLVIFNHNDLRARCAENKNFIDFLIFAIEELGSSGVITIVCTIIRRIPIDKQFVHQLADKGLVKVFVQKARETDDSTKVSSHSLLLFLNTIAEYSYLDEFLGLVDIVVDKTTNDQNLCEIASYVAVTFAKYDQLRDRMVQLKLDQFFRDKKDDRKYKRLSKNAEKFLKMI